LADKADAQRLTQKPFWPRDPPHTELDCGKRDEGHEGLREVFEVLCEASVSAKPCECSLNNPSFRDHPEADSIGCPTDDLHPRRIAGCRGLEGLLRIVSAIGEDAFKPWEATADLGEQQDRAIPVLNASGVDHDAHRQAERVDKRVDLAAFYRLACVVSHGVGCVGG
jgi:hypothetical protein